VFWKCPCHSVWQGLGGHFMACKECDVTRVVCVFTAGSRLGKEELSVSSRWEIEGSGMVSAVWIEDARACKDIIHIIKIKCGGELFLM